MVNQKIRNYFNDLGKEYDEEFIFLDNQAYDNSIIGHTEDCRLIYSYDHMIEELTQEYIDDDPERANNPDDFVRKEFLDEARLDAIEWIEYNTLRTLPYLGEKAPIIMYELDKGEFHE